MPSHERFNKQPNDREKVIPPEGGTGDDFNGLSNSAVTEIATNPHIDQTDAKNAESEIARRQAWNIYNLDDESQDADGIYRELEKAGYRFKEGDDGKYQLEYPTREYVKYLENPEEHPLPDKLRETLEARVEDSEITGDQEEVANESSKLVNDWNIWKQKDRDKEKQNTQTQNKNRTAVIAAKKTAWEEETYSPDLLAIRNGALNQPPVDNLESAVKHAEWALKKKNRARLYAEGALVPISEGNFSQNPNYIYDGLKSLEGKEIDERAGQSREKAWEEIRNSDALRYSLTIESLDTLNSLERGAIESAIELGVLESRKGFLGEKEFKTALPIGKLGSENINEYLRQYDLTIGRIDNVVDEDNKENEDRNFELYEKYEGGFVNIVDALKHDVGSEKGYDALNWYFDSMLQGYDEETVCHRVMNTYEASEETSFRNKFNHFMEWRKKREKDVNSDFGSPDTSEKSKDDSDKDEEEYAYLDGSQDAAGVFGQIRDMRIKIMDGGVFEQLDGRRNINKRNGKNAKNSWRCPDRYGEKKYEAFEKAISEIETLDGFKKHDPYLKLSKPFYLRKKWKKKNEASPEANSPEKNERLSEEEKFHFLANQAQLTSLDYNEEDEPLEGGDTEKEKMEVDYVQVVPAYYDEEKDLFRAGDTNNGVSSRNVRSYVTAYFEINGLNVTIIEGITNMSSALYVAAGDFTLDPDSRLFQGSMKNTVREIKRHGGEVFKKNHQRDDEDFRKMWNSVIEWLKERTSQSSQAN